MDEAPVRPAMRFLISLLSSLFLHSSKPPAAAGFLCGGEGLGSGVSVEGRTGDEKRNDERKTKSQKRLTFKDEGVEPSPWVSSCLSDALLLSSFSCLLSRTHSCSLASNSSCKCCTEGVCVCRKHGLEICDVRSPRHPCLKDTCGCAPETARLSPCCCCC